MEFKAVFVEKSLCEHRVTKAILSRLPSAECCIVEGRTWHRDIKNAMFDCGLPQRRCDTSDQDYEDHAVELLTPRYPERAVRFVAKVGAGQKGVKDLRAGYLGRGEVCALAKEYLFLSHTGDYTLVKPSRRGCKAKNTPVLCCNYTQLNPASSCPYLCLYCFESALRGKENPFMRFYVNYHDMYRVLRQLDTGDIPDKSPFTTSPCWYSVNMGEHADSLAQEKIFRLLPDVVAWFHDFQNLHLLLVTKGGDANDLPDDPPAGRVGVTCSINTEAASRALEVGTPGPIERLQTLKKAREKGYKVAIRLDPLIAWPEDWKGQLEGLVDLIHTGAPDDLADITVGTMRFRPNQHSLFLNTFNSSRVETPIGGLYADHSDPQAIDHLYGQTPSTRSRARFADGYFRFPFEDRKEIYRHVVSLVKQRRPNLSVTLCQEEQKMYEAVPGGNIPDTCNCRVARWPTYQIS